MFDNDVMQGGGIGRDKKLFLQSPWLYMLMHRIDKNVLQDNQSIGM